MTTTNTNTNTNTSFTIIEEHEIETFSGVDIIDTSYNDANISYDTLNDSDGGEHICIYNKSDNSYKCENREINQNSLENIEINILKIELSINITSVEEVIFKKHNVEIVDKKTNEVIIEGIISSYKLVGRSYDPDIVLVFNDGRTFYNDNFGYMFRFYM